MTDAVAYFWSAKVALDAAWRGKVERFVVGVPGIALDVADRKGVTITLSDGIHDSLRFHFARGRGGGTVNLRSGARLIVASLGVAARLKLELSDSNGDALRLSEPRALLCRIPFAERASQIETLAEEVGLIPKRVRLETLGASAEIGRHGRIFFS